MRRSISLITVLYLSFILSSCATVGSLNGVRQKGDRRVIREVFLYPKDKVWKAVKIAVADAGLGIQMVNETEGKIYAKSPLKMTQFMWTGTGMGEFIGVYVTSIEENKTQVEIVIQKSYLLDIGYTDYRNIVMNNIRTQLAIQ